MKLKNNDKVIVIAGKDKGVESKVTRVLPKQNKVIVENVNRYKRHMKAQGKERPGGIIEIERPIDVSKVQLISPITGKPTRVGIERDKTGIAIRICKNSGKPIDDTKKKSKK